MIGACYGMEIITRVERREGQGSQPKAKLARLTIDLDPEVHAKFKAKYALRGTNMVEEVRGFINSQIAG